MQEVLPPLTADARALDAFIDRATGASGDETVDRVLEAFRVLRAGLHEAAWFSMPGMRDFLTRHALANPYIPPAIREREIASRRIPHDSANFIPSWQALGQAVADMPIDPADFVSSSEADPDTAKRFAQRFPQGGRPMLLKFAEYQIAIDTAREMGAQQIVDYTGEQSFAPLATELLWDASVLRVAVGAGSAPRRVADRIRHATAPAGTIPMADGTVDLVLVGETLPRMAGDGDKRFMDELRRVLRPGGQALVLPLLVAGKHSLTVNPAAAFLVRRQDPIAPLVQGELLEHDARIDFNHGMSIPFARRYEAATVKARLGESGLKPRILRPRFQPGLGGDRWHEKLFGQDIPSDLFTASRMIVLALTREG